MTFGQPHLGIAVWATGRLGATVWATGHFGATNSMSNINFTVKGALKLLCKQYSISIRNLSQHFFQHYFSNCRLKMLKNFHVFKHYLSKSQALAEEWGHIAWAKSIWGLKSS